MNCHFNRSRCQSVQCLSLSTPFCYNIDHNFRLGHLKSWSFPRTRFAHSLGSEFFLINLLFEGLNFFRQSIQLSLLHNVGFRQSLGLGSCLVSRRLSLLHDRRMSFEADLNKLLHDSVGLKYGPDKGTLVLHGSWILDQGYF
jgi:hypothetical protein